jgi:Right handed beta helix region
MLRTTIVIAAGLALAALLPAVPAQAQGAARTFVSAAGSDANNCINVASPCRHMAAAFAATATDGEIYVLDPANYGSLTITHAVSIEGHGWASIAPTSGNAAITINAPAFDKINIIGVVLDGTAVASTTGIHFNSGESLNVRDSVIRNFNGTGIDFVPAVSEPSQLVVSNTLLSDNAGDGISISPGASAGTVTGVIDHVTMANNSLNGLYVLGGNNALNVTISDSVSVNNAFGIFAQGGAVLAYVAARRCNISNNVTGVEADGTAIIRLSQSQITANTKGWKILGGSVGTTNDNLIDNNPAGNGAPAPLAYK